MVQSLAPGLPAPLSVWGWLEGQVGSGNCLTMCGLWGPQLCIVVSAACTLLPPPPELLRVRGGAPAWFTLLLF